MIHVMKPRVLSSVNLKVSIVDIFFLPSHQGMATIHSTRTLIALNYIHTLGFHPRVDIHNNTRKRMLFCVPFLRAAGSRSIYTRS